MDITIKCCSFIPSPPTQLFVTAVQKYEESLSCEHDIIDKWQNEKSKFAYCLTN